MNDPKTLSFPSISLSHLELYVNDVNGMEQFYTRLLGFIVTDRGQGPNAMVFLSANPGEHHQLVLNPRDAHKTAIESPVDHISFRVDSITDLRMFYQVLCSGSIESQTVSHGTAWSVYFRDPENNRLEFFTDTPWHVNQPCRFNIDLHMSDAELMAFTKSKIKDLPGFDHVDNWRKSHAREIGL